MKKITLLITSFTMGSFLFGQSPINNKLNLTGPITSKKKNLTVNDHLVSNNSMPTKNPSSAVVWSDDFSVPANWTISSSVGAGVWQIGMLGPQGSYSITAINSTTKANGFALFDSDLDCSGNQVADITTANPIDCSTHPAVVLVFQQQYRRFYDSTFVFVSNNGTTWDKYPVNVLVTNTSYAGPNPTITKVNITPTAGGQATVYVRFEFYSPSSLGSGAGCAYSWMIDDVSIEDQPANDITVGSTFYGEYSRIPNGQQSPIDLGAAVINSGSGTETNVVLSASVNTTLFTGSSASLASMAVNEIDTLAISTQFTPGAVGSYVFSFAATQTETDANPGDNTVTGRTIKVTDSTFARDNYNYTGAGLWNGGGTAFEYGNLFLMAADANATSVNFVLQSSTLAGSVVSVKLYDNTFGSGGATLGVSNSYTIAPADIASTHGANPVSVTLPFTTPIPLTGGQYYLASVEFLNASGGDTVVLASGTDIVQPLQTSFIYDTPSSTWYYTESTPMIRLNVITNVGIDEVKNQNGITLLQNQPNPFNDISVISYEINKTENVTLNIFDATGKKVVAQNEGIQACGKHTVSFNAQNLSVGLYYYSLTVGNRTTSVKKMSVIK